MINVLLAYGEETNSIVEEFKSIINGDNEEANYINFQKADINTRVSDYDKTLVFIDDDKGVLESYYRLYNEAKDCGNVGKIVVYYKERSEYETKEVYYAKKDANKNRLIRFFDFCGVADIVFDFIAALYCDGAIFADVRRGKLRISGRSIANPLSNVKLIGENAEINEYALRIERAERTLDDVKKDDLFDKRYIDELTEMAKNIDGIYRDYDRLLTIAFELYAESVRAFLNRDIDVIDYIFLKEYVMTGQFGSAQGVFVTRRFMSLFDSVNENNADNILACLKMRALSFVFKEDNSFNTRALRAVFELGKKIEKEFSKDRFFHYAYADFAAKLRDERDRADVVKSEYLEFVMDENVIADEKHLVAASRFVAGELEKNQRFDEASDTLNFALDRVRCEMNAAYMATLLGVLNYERENYELAKEYYAKVAGIMRSVNVRELIAYIKFITKITDAFLPFDGAEEWLGKLVEETEKADIEDFDKAKIYLRYAMIMMKEYSHTDGIEKYFESAGKLFENSIRLRPTECLIGIHDALIHSAMLFESKEDMPRAVELYSLDKKILECIGSLYENVDEMLAYNEYLSGIMSRGGSPSKSFRFLINAERISTKYIERTKNYVKYYAKLLFAIVERYYADGKKIQGTIIARAKLAKLIDAANINCEYLRDLAYFTRNLARIYDTLGYDELYEEFAYMSESYFSIATRANVKVDESLFDDMRNRIETLK